MTDRILRSLIVWALIICGCWIVYDTWLMRDKPEMPTAEPQPVIDNTTSAEADYRFCFGPAPEDGYCEQGRVISPALETVRLVAEEASRQATDAGLSIPQVREFVYFALQTVSQESGGDPNAVGLNESTDWKCLTGETDCVEYANYGLFQLNAQYYTNAAQMTVQENITKGVAHALGLWVGCRGRKAEARRHYRAGGTC